MALAWCGARKSVAPLLAALDDDDWITRQAAYVSLTNLTGMEFPFRSTAAPPERAAQAKAWRDWWATVPADRPPQEVLDLLAGAKNWPSGYTVTASTTYRGPPSVLCDGQIGPEYWQTKNVPFPQWCQIDLGQVQKVAQVVVHQYGPEFVMTEYELSTSLDGRTFEVVEHRRGATPVELAVRFPQREARYVRITSFGTVRPIYPTTFFEVEIHETPQPARQAAAQPEWRHERGLRALGALGGDGATAAVLECLGAAPPTAESYRPMVRAGIRALGRLRDEAGFQALLALLDNLVWARHAAAEALADLGNDKALAALQKAAVSHSFESVRHVARDALEAWGVTLPRSWTRSEDVLSPGSTVQQEGATGSSPARAFAALADKPPVAPIPLSTRGSIHEGEGAAGPSFPRWSGGTSDDVEGIVFIKGDNAIPNVVNTVQQADNWRVTYVVTDSGPAYRPGRNLYVLRPPRPDGEVVPLTHFPGGYVAEPELSWDAGQVVFTHRGEDDPWWHVWRVNLDGSGLVQLTEGPYHDVGPVYLPDGRIAFGSSRGGVRDEYHAYPCTPLYVMNPDGTGLHAIAINIGRDNEPAVLPDGRIVFSRLEVFYSRNKTELTVHAVHPRRHAGRGALRAGAARVLDAPVPGGAARAGRSGERAAHAPRAANHPAAAHARREARDRGDPGRARPDRSGARHGDDRHARQQAPRLHHSVPAPRRPRALRLDAQGRGAGEGRPGSVPARSSDG